MIYSIGEIEFNFLVPFVVVVTGLFLTLFIFNKLKPIISYGKILVIYLSLLFSAFVFSFIEMQAVNKALDEGEVIKVFGKISSIYYSNDGETVSLGGKELYVSYSQLYCFSTSKVLNKGDDVIIYFVRLTDGAETFNLCITQIDKI